jgi:MarR family transcriptional regulator, lower aerobic nicotinate degradation pathway regulator
LEREAGTASDWQASKLKERAMARPAVKSKAAIAEAGYTLEDQVGFVLRQVQQRHTLIFANRIGQDLTPTQWAALAKLFEAGACSQNLLGRLTAMDAATIKGVVDRLVRRKLARTCPDPANRRRLLVDLTPEGRELVRHLMPPAHQITAETLAPLSAAERETFLALLKKMR